MLIRLGVAKSRSPRSKLIWLFVAVTLIFNGQRARISSGPMSSRFEDVASRVGLSVPHSSSRTKDFVIDTISGGIGFIDCDNDGRLDILVVNGSTVEEYKRSGGNLMVTLYHQDSDFKFHDITQGAGLSMKGWGMGVAVADYDNDGLQDIYVTGYGHNVLYHNLGACRFEDVTEAAGVAAGGFSTAAAWADYDRDGNVDLFVTRYVQLDLDHLPLPGSGVYCNYMGHPVHCGPQGLPGESDLLFHNRGNGTFEETSKPAGVAGSEPHYGLGAIWADYDNDGWPDLYVANDAGSNYLYHNQKNGKFEEVGMAQGVALSSAGAIQGSMGVDWGDFDHDGRLDLVVSAFTGQSIKLYRNPGSLGFADVGVLSHVAVPSAPYIGWGAGWFDMNNSGWLDLVVSNGHVYPQADLIPGSPSYRQPVLLFRNLRDGSYEDVSSELRDVLAPASWRGLALGDVNNDGCVDLVLSNIDGPPGLVMNYCPPNNHSVLFKFLGTRSNRAGIGTRIILKTKKATQSAEVRGGGSYMSQNDLRLHFGLGNFDRADLVEVRWPSGTIDRIRNVPAGFIYCLREGEGIISRIKLGTINAG
jgi:hypothetical protein